MTRINHRAATLKFLVRRPDSHLVADTMFGNSDPISILMAEDDPNDRLLTQEALSESHAVVEIDFVADGLELLQLLRREGRYAERAGAPLPGIILLDLNMPRMDGREALTRLKTDPQLKHIPVVILTNSKDDDDIMHAYELGASSYVLKPSGFHELVTLMDEICRYWFRVVELPH